MHEDEWIPTGPHQFVDCWCGHAEANPLNGKTLELEYDRVHRWVSIACPEDCPQQTRVHGHVHIHCPICAHEPTDGTCCTPPGLS